jgi:hypothetical protein
MTAPNFQLTAERVGADCRREAVCSGHRARGVLRDRARDRPYRMPFTRTRRG